MLTQVFETLVNEPCVAYSFEDGFEEQATAIAPVLEHFGIIAALSTGRTNQANS